MFKLFETSQHTDLYSKYRPSYPSTLYDKIFPKISSSSTDQGFTILDVACGSGQASFDLALRNCNLLIGIDPSVNQIGHATSRLAEIQQSSESVKIYFETAKAEDLDSIVQKHAQTLNLDTNNQNCGVFDLITVAQGLHWFDFPVFFQLVDKYLKRGGVFAAWCYVGNRFDCEQAQRARDSFYDGEDLKPFWSERREFVDKQYKTIPNVPYQENLEFDIDWKHSRMSIMDYMNYIRTWSAVNSYGEKYGIDAKERLLADYQQNLMAAFGFKHQDEEFDYHIPYHLLTTRKP